MPGTVDVVLDVFTRMYPQTGSPAFASGAATNSESTAVATPDAAMSHFLTWIRDTAHHLFELAADPPETA